MPGFSNCDNYGFHRASNLNSLNDDKKTNDTKLHQQSCRTFKIDYLEMDIITRLKARLEHKINISLLACVPNAIKDNSREPVTYSDRNEQENLHFRSKRATQLLVIAQGTAAIGNMLIKGINALLDAKRASSFNNAIKVPNANVENTHNRLVTLENKTSMMAKAPQVLARYLEIIKDDLEEMAPEYKPVFTSVYQYYGNSLASFTNTINDLLLQLTIVIILKVQVPMLLFSVETAPVTSFKEMY